LGLPIRMGVDLWSTRLPTRWEM